MLLQSAVRAVASSLLSQKTACARSRERRYAAMTRRLRADLSLASARFFGARRLWWSRTRWTTSVFIFLAVRFSSNGGPKNGGEPRERISLENCIRAYTSGSAYAQFEEGKKGELKQGEYADLSSFRMISPKSPPPSSPKRASSAPSSAAARCTRLLDSERQKLCSFPRAPSAHLRAGS